MSRIVFHEHDLALYARRLTVAMWPGEVLRLTTVSDAKGRPWLITKAEISQLGEAKP